MKVKIFFPVLVIAIISFFTLWVTKGIDHSLSEQMAYEILIKQPQEVKSYCLDTVSENSPSNTLVSKLNKANINSRVCTGDFIWSVYIGKFKRTGFNEITVSYGYDCGMLCSGRSKCILKEKFGGKVELQGCKLLLSS